VADSPPDAGGGEDGAVAQSPDAQPADASPSDAVPLQTGDQLEIPPLQVVPGLAECFETSIVHRDGTSSALAASTPGLTVAVDTPDVARPALPHDCAEDLVGVIGLKPGAARLTLTLGAQGTELTASQPVQVLPLTAEIVPSATTLLAPLGAVTKVDLMVHTYDAAHREVEPPPVDVPASLLQLSVADIQIATATSVIDYDKRVPAIFGASRGQTTATLTYGPPSDRKSTAPITINVPGGGMLSHVGPIQLTQLNGDPIPGSRVEHGTCAALHLDGTFMDAMLGTYSAEITSGVRWSTSGGNAHLVDGSPEQLCADQMGEQTITACYSGSCISILVPTYTDADITGLSVDVRNGQVALPCPNRLPSATYCPQVRYTLHLAQGTRDVTYDALISLSGVAGGTFIPFFAETNMDGTTASDPSGNPCYSDYTFPAGIGAGSYNTTVSIGYAGYMNASAQFQLVLDVMCN
jgi:hypothetical protein